MDLSREVCDLLGQVLVLSSQVRIGLEQGLELVGLHLERRNALGRTALDILAVLLELTTECLVARGLTRLREQNQWGRVGGLSREPEVEEDEGLGVPVVHERNGVERDPHNDDQGLADDVLRSPEKASRALG